VDKNTLIGLVLIGSLLSIFTIMNQPTKEDVQHREEEQRTLTQEKQRIEQEQQIEEVATSKAKTQEIEVVQETVVPVDTSATDSLVYLENEKYKIGFNTRGGIVAGVWLKEYQTHYNYVKNGDKITPLALFRDGDAVNELVFELDGKPIKTGSLPFRIKTHSDKSIVLASELAPGKIIEQQYVISDNAYHMDYTVNMIGFSDNISSKGVGLNWALAFRKTERLLSEQRRVSTICMNYEKDGFDYLSEMSDDDEQAEDNVAWVAYKQSYFSSILRANDKNFQKKGTEFEVSTYSDKDPRNATHIKDFSSMLMIDMPRSDRMSVSFEWFFGPNDYTLLASYDHGYDHILNYGWGLFRWINVYAIQPLYSMLTQSFAISAGIAILLLTLIIKFILMPIQWKMYVSSAKMRILKPEIDALNKKYPKQEDAMKKQMEMMTLYRESGASPLSGCVPMLIQMPILLAVFRFFPATFDLRQQSFLWAEDLSSYDSIFNFSFHIPFYGNHISLFTLLMSATTLIYTAINSGNMQTPQQPGMPNMKVIMYMFPIMMIFFFNSYASGLSYYYFISTLLSILIMVLIKNFFVDEQKLHEKMQAKKAEASTNGKKKSKFQERLETMQKLQQEQLKNKKKK